MINIRPASAEDVEVITDFNRRLAQETEARALDKARLTLGVTALLANPERGRYFMAEADGNIVGQLMITYEWSDWRNGLFWWIQSVYVTAEARRNGVFAALYDHIQSLANDDDGVCGIRLYVEHANDRAQQTYETVGMTKTSYQVMEADFTSEADHHA